MPNPYGRPKANTTYLYARIPEELFFKLMVQRKNLFKPLDPTHFKHGAAGKYITSLIKADLEQEDETGSN